ncbi:type I polyketide synthase [Sorangium sp. So ce176]|uniref:type I polyketide synthase n=1 Tax=Sorangium sp. So ce176 TaxID=3133286 RepID=UPI003F61E74F
MAAEKTEASPKQGMNEGARSRDPIALLKASFIEIEKLQRKLDAAEARATEPIAIVGAACRLPDGIETPEDLWRLLLEGVDAVIEIPRDRWDVDAYFDPDRDAPGKVYCRNGSFLDRVDEFDAEFFGIAPREAKAMDPQQRLLLEVGWEALERAGIAVERLRDTRTGVFVGIMHQDYSRLLSDPDALDIHSGAGNAVSIAAGRLSYVLGLQGPALTLDTACSSSLVAIHVACQSLRARECSLALAGGANVNVSPISTIVECRAHMLSPSGRCRAFDASADGFVRGEGCAIVVLKRLHDAIADGDDVLAVIRGSAVNHDGASGGLTVPSGAAQEALIRAALEGAQVKPSQVGYIEAHGTGTALGDPIEMLALSAAVGEGHTKDSPLLVGSVKTNFGHLEGAAGVVGFLKAALAVKHGEIPANLHLHEPNPHIPWSSLPVEVVCQRVPWPEGDGPRIAGVSSFGFSGTNAHVVLEEPGPHARRRPSVARSEADPASPHLLVLSAKTEPALAQLAARYSVMLGATPTVELADVCFSASTGRSHFRHRLAVVTSSVAELCEQLAAFSRGVHAPGVTAGASIATRSLKIAFLFTGQGSQLRDMGRGLYETEPVFRASLDRLDAFARPHLGVPLVHILFPEPGAAPLLDRTEYAQPALFALEIALVELWRSWGIEPAVVLGHSLGEYAAACAAGVFSAEDGLLLVLRRARCMQSVDESGEMVAVRAGVTVVEEALAASAEDVVIAAINGDAQTVISGRRASVERVVSRLRERRIATVKLRTSHAFHSPLMDAIRDGFTRAIRDIPHASPRLTLISNLTGRPFDGEKPSAEYWSRHLRAPVRFADGLDALHAQGCDVLVEIGPGSTLLEFARERRPDGSGVRLPSLSPVLGDPRCILTSLGELYARGARVDWSAVHRARGGARVDLPTYPFQRRRYWVDAPRPRERATETPGEGSLVTRLLEQERAQELAGLLHDSGALHEVDRALLARVADALVREHRRQLPRRVDGSLYEVQWNPSPRRRADAAHAPTGDRRTWILFVDEGGVGDTLAGVLRQRGDACRIVRKGMSFHELGSGEWQIAPTEASHVERLWAALHEEARGAPGIVHLWSLDARCAADASADALAEAMRLSCGSALHLVQAATKHAPTAKIWWVTRGAVATERDGAPALAQAPLWGMGRAIALEHPEGWGGLVDLAPVAEVGEATALAAQLCDPAGDDQVALRRGRVYVARLRRYAPPPTSALAIREDGAYLISGGLGALGLHVATWLVERGARHLFLFGRSAPSPAAEQTLNRLRARGSRIHVLAADAASERDVARVLDEVRAAGVPLRGIVHAAGALDDGVLLLQDWERFRKVVEPKARGAWLLHELSHGSALDFFILFSSATAILGSPGQANYAAANAFLDALAHHRRARGLPALSVNWGPWGEAGMAARAEVERRGRLERSGVEALSPERALLALEQTVGGGHPQIGIFDIDWPLFGARLPATQRSSLLAELLPRAHAPRAQLESPPRDVLESVLRTPATDRAPVLRALVAAQLAGVLEREDAEAIDAKTSLLELGLDSLMAVELKSWIKAFLGIDVPLELFLGGSTLEDLAERVTVELALRELVAPAPPITASTDAFEIIEL